MRTAHGRGPEVALHMETLDDKMNCNMNNHKRDDEKGINHNNNTDSNSMA